MTFRVAGGGATGGSGTVTQVNTGTGLVGGPITTVGSISIAPTGVVTATYGSVTTVPVAGSPWTYTGITSVNLLSGVSYYVESWATDAGLDLETIAPARASNFWFDTTAPASTWTEDRVENMDSVDFENMPMAQLKQIGELIDREAANKRVSTVGRR
mgnify:CR=1 FL=1